MFKTSNTINCLYLFQKKQRGAALMVMLVILILGGTAMLLSSLNSVTPRLARDRVTADALAQAKEALVGYAVKDSNRPGELPCPDINGNGKLEMNVDYGPGTLCKQFTGYLPWKTLGLPELQDGSNSKLWYAVSKNFYAGNTVPLNSDTLGQLAVIGNISLNNLAAIVFAPGAPLCSQSHSGNNIDQYLEAMSPVSATSAVAKANSLDCATAPYNDSFLAISADQVLQPVEKRIAREIKKCLDDYASTSGQKYPWAAPVSPLSYNSTPNTLFGRIPDHPSDSVIRDMLDKISTLQTSVKNCALTNNSANQTALVKAGLNLSIAAALVATSQPTAPAIPTTVTVPAKTAGDSAQDSGRCANILADPPNDIVQTNLNTANMAISSITGIYWPASCTLITSAYWADWKNLAFYQIANGYKPGTITPACGTSCLSITGSGHSNAGSGSYRAAIVVAGKKLANQSRPSSKNPPIDYLSNSTSEGLTASGLVANAHDSAGTSTAFKTYTLSDPDYPNINDLVLCLDGKNNCK